jgi:molybdenum cofactor cytidylyltransferase
MLTAIVLAAGLSSRMGNDNKLLLRYKNKTVIANIVETILAAEIEEVIVVTGHQAALVTAALYKLPVQFVNNPGYTEGMTSSIQQGVQAATGSGYIICLSDMVTITTAEYIFLSKAFGQRMVFDTKCICIPQYKKKKGNPVIFSAFYKDALLQNINPQGCKNIVQANKEHISIIEMDTPHILQDFDDPDDYKQIDHPKGHIP